MLDIKLVRNNTEIIENNLKKRGDLEKIKLLKELIKIDNQYRAALKSVENLKHERNLITRKIAQLKKAGKDIKTELKKVAALPDEIKKTEALVIEKKGRINEILMQLPNILDETVPRGKDDSDNIEIKKWGKAPKFDFVPKNHFEILENLGLIDQERAGKVAGAGFYYLKNEAVLLDFALQRFAIDFLMKKGYVLIEPPYMINRKAYEGMVDPSDFEQVSYKIDGEQMYMIATAEHPLGAMYMNNVFNRDELPLKLIGVSPCFRKEIGSHGKYTKGLFRMHQFNKVEQFIFCVPEQSKKLHEELQKDCEELYQALGLHYRVVNVCTGDIGSVAAKKYDTEAWMADGKFREIGSNSNCTDYQTRRLNIRYREKEGQAPIGFVHTLNNTALATSRTMIAILEQNQQKDGSVIIPKVLRKYMGGIKVIKNRVA